MIKFWAWVYRMTGWFSPCAKAAEAKYIKGQLSQIDQDLLKEMDWRLTDYVGLKRGMWQAKHGFLRPYKFKQKSPNNITVIGAFWVLKCAIPRVPLSLYFDASNNKTPV